jgi:hypothetical protein
VNVLGNAATGRTLHAVDPAKIKAFYTGPLGAVQTSRVPDTGPAFYRGLHAGNSELGLVADAEDAA